MLTFKESLRLKQIAEDTFVNVHEPWTWPAAPVIPGGLLMSEAAAAAYKTVPDDFVLDSLQTHFIGGPVAKIPMTFQVTRLSNGRRFVIRSVVMEQNEKVLLHVSLSFVNSSPWTAPSMAYSASRQTSHTVSEITLDDLEVGRGRLGSFMKFQRLPLTFKDSSKTPVNGIATSVAQITPPIGDPTDSLTHILGVINMSDYHVMDAPLQFQDITFGLYALGDKSRRPTENKTKVSTSLNHSITFHSHTGFCADELTYIEVGTAWAKDGRAMLSSQIFSKDGLLIATCTQESFYVLKEWPKAQKTAKI